MLNQHNITPRYHYGGHVAENMPVLVVSLYDKMSPGCSWNPKASRQQVNMALSLRWSRLNQCPVSQNKSQHILRFVTRTIPAACASIHVGIQALCEDRPAGHVFTSPLFSPAANIWTCYSAHHCFCLSEHLLFVLRRDLHITCIVGDETFKK